jgi:RIO-like serine/threonine protein kinase
MGKKLGEGCHSSVYKCIQKQDKKIFAVKMTKQKDLEIF